MLDSLASLASRSRNSGTKDDALQQGETNRTADKVHACAIHVDRGAQVQGKPGDVGLDVVLLLAKENHMEPYREPYTINML